MKNLKTLIIILTLSGLALFYLSSCSDSLGIDPNVVRIENNNSKGNNHIIKVDFINMSITEWFMLPYQGGFSLLEMDWKNYYRIIDKDIIIDTSNSFFKISIKHLYIKSIVPDSEFIIASFDTITNRTTYIELKVDSIPGLKKAAGKIDGTWDSNNSCIIRTKSFTDNTEEVFTGHEKKITYSVIELNKIEKYILIEFKAEISEKMQKVNTLAFDLIINY